MVHLTPKNIGLFVGIGGLCVATMASVRFLQVNLYGFLWLVVLGGPPVTALNLYARGRSNMGQWSLKAFAIGFSIFLGWAGILAFFVVVATKVFGIKW